MLPRNRHHLVRITRPTRISRAASMSLLAACGAALLFLAVWRIWRTDAPAMAHLRTLDEINLLWECEDDHSFQAPAQAGPITCADADADCSKEADLVDWYYCDVAKHGRVKVTARLGADWSPANPSLHLSVWGSKFVPAEEGLICPQQSCDNQLYRVPQDPIEKALSQDDK